MERVVNEPFSEPRDDSGFPVNLLYFRIFSLGEKGLSFLFVCFVTFCEFVGFSSCQKTTSRKSYTVIKVNKPLRT